ncbi:MAG: hypothetical protein SGPRY_005306, partial [Prymnesium sp.]
SMMMMINKMNTTALPTPQKPDFEKFSGQLSEDVLGKFKAILSDFENKIESQEIYDSAAVKEIEAQQKKMHSMFEGQDGLVPNIQQLCLDCCYDFLGNPFHSAVLYPTTSLTH